MFESHFWAVFPRRKSTPTIQGSKSAIRKKLESAVASEETTWEDIKTSVESYAKSDNFEEYRTSPPPADWPWEASWWKPKQPQRDLIRAAALLAAEVDRIERDIVKRGAELYK